MKIKTQNYRATAGSALTSNDVAVVELQGELDSDSSELFQNTITPLSSGEDRKGGIVLDMSDVGFIDSAGLEQLLCVQDYCNENDCQLRLAGLDETLMKILEVTRLENEFECCAELAEAVKSFA